LEYSYDAQTNEQQKKKKKGLKHERPEVHISEKTAKRITIITFISSNINFSNNVHTCQ